MLSRLTITCIMFGLYPPGCAVADASPAHKLTGRNANFDLGQEEQGWKPDHQWQLGSMKDRITSQRHPLTATVALKKNLFGHAKLGSNECFDSLDR